MKNDFCVFILSHGRPDNVITYTTLRSHGYTGRIYVVIDNEDKRKDEYVSRFGEYVLIFDKKKAALSMDEGDNSGDRRAILYARNVCFDLAKWLGVDYFVELDDDYYWFGYRTENGGLSIRKLDAIFDVLIDFLNTNDRILSVAFSQGGDHIGGYNPNKQISRKAMNSFVCKTDRPFQFFGRINEDVNTYVNLGGKGYIFFTIMGIQLDQNDTQSSSGGMTELYKLNGTYVKSFYSVMYNPSCVKVTMMPAKHPRLHHKIDWNNAVPKIISCLYKKE